MARVYGLGRWALFWRVILPGALPSVLVGLRFSLGIMWLTLIVAETISASSGIGYMTMNAREFLQTDVVLLGIIIYALLGKLADVLTRALERRALAWHPAYQTAEAQAMTGRRIRAHDASKAAPTCICSRASTSPIVYDDDRAPAPRRAPCRGSAGLAERRRQGFRRRGSVLEGLDLEIPAGQFVAIVGRSGGGKTTIMRLLAGLDTPTAGAIADRRPRRCAGCSRRCGCCSRMRGCCPGRP